jgi:hypothetical protein
MISAGGSVNSVCGSATMGLLGDVLSAGSLQATATTAMPGEHVSSSNTVYCLLNDTSEHVVLCNFQLVSGLRLTLLCYQRNCSSISYTRFSSLTCSVCNMRSH